MVDRLKKTLPKGIDRLTWDYDKGNESSKAAAEYNGFKENDPKYSCKEWEYECAIQTVPVKEFTQIVNENVVFNVNNIMYNVEDFTSGKSNILLITGLSGSGKSTLADKMAKEHKAEVIELDVFEHCYGYADKDLHQAGDVFVEYLSAHRDVWDKLKKQQLTGKKIHAELYKFIMYTLAWCESRKNKRWILEGVQIYSCLTAVEALQYPLIIMGTSATNSILQRFKRNVGGGNIDWSAELKNDFPELLEWYWSEEKHLSDFKKEVRIAEEATTMYGLVGLKLTGSLNLLLEADDNDSRLSLSFSSIPITISLIVSIGSVISIFIATFVTISVINIIRIIIRSFISIVISSFGIIRIISCLFFVITFLLVIVRL